MHLAILYFFISTFGRFTFAQQDCGDASWVEIAGKCYFIDLASQKTSVNGARSKCAFMKSKPPMFSNFSEYTEFNNYMADKFPNLIIPLDLELINDKWTWANDGSTPESGFWQIGALQKNIDGTRKCAVRSDKEWQNVNCDQTADVNAVCQRGLIKENMENIPCTPLYRFSDGWAHMLTTNQAEARERNFLKNETDVLGSTIYAPAFYVPNVTQPLYEVQNAKSLQRSIVNSDDDLFRLTHAYNFTVIGIVAYSMVSSDFADVTSRHLSWSSDPPTDSVVSGEEEYRKYLINWNYKEKPPLYFFNRTAGAKYCKLERNCTVGDWGPWSPCSATCGNGTRARKRTVIVPPTGNTQCAQAEDQEACAQELCITPKYITQEQVDAMQQQGILDSLADPQSLIASVTNAVLPALFSSHSGIHPAGHQLNDTVELCMYDDTPCDVQKLFGFSVNPFYGNCFTFNPRDNEINVTKAGPQGGLRLLLRVQQYDYWGCTQHAGFKVYMHPPDEYPFVETFGYNIAPGLLTSMAVSMAKLIKKDTPNNPCTDSASDPLHPGISFYYDGIYTPEGCTRSCLQNYVISKCDCADPRYGKPNNISFCPDLDDAIANEKINYTRVKTLCPDYFQNSTCIRGDYLKKAGCSCVSQCERTYFEAVINTAMLLKTKHMEEIACEEVNHTAGCKDHATNHFALLEMYYERLQTVIFEEEEAKTAWELFQDISNMLQNINGFDFFAIFEVVFLLAEVVTMTCLGKRKRTQLRKSNVSLIRLLADDTTLVDVLFFIFTFVGSLVLLAFIYCSKILDINW